MLRTRAVGVNYQILKRMNFIFSFLVYVNANLRIVLSLPAGIKREGITTERLKHLVVANN